MTTIVKDKATSRDAELAKLKAQAKKKTAVAALKQKKAEAAAEDKKKQDEVECINLDNLTKETKEIGEEEKRAIEEEEKKIRGIAPNKEIIGLNDMVIDDMEDEEVNMEIYVTHSQPVQGHGCDLGKNTVYDKLSYIGVYD